MKLGDWDGKVQLPQMWRKASRMCMSGLYADMCLFQHKSKTEVPCMGSTLQADSHPVVWSHHRLLPLLHAQGYSEERNKAGFLRLLCFFSGL